MHRRKDAQRQHIIHSLDTLLYQLHTLSFILSPSIWSYVCRLMSQFQSSKPRELDSSRSLRFFFGFVLLLNASSIWSHASKEAVESRAVILDFVGLSHVPSKLQLLFLDFLIIFLQILLITIAYETSLSNEASPDTPDTLLPNSSPTTSSFNSKLFYPPHDSALVLDLRVWPLWQRLRSAPPTSNASNSHLLPLHNRSWLPPAITAFRRARDELRQLSENRPTNLLQGPPGGMAAMDGG